MEEADVTVPFGAKAEAVVGVCYFYPHGSSSLSSGDKNWGKGIASSQLHDLITFNPRSFPFFLCDYHVL